MLGIPREVNWFWLPRLGGTIFNMWADQSLTQAWGLIPIPCLRASQSWLWVQHWTFAFLKHPFYTTAVFWAFLLRRHEVGRQKRTQAKTLSTSNGTSPNLVNIARFWDVSASVVSFLLLQFLPVGILEPTKCTGSGALYGAPQRHVPHREEGMGV